MPVHRAICGALLIMGLCWQPPSAAAQSAVGSGPLTSALTDTEPTAGVLKLGLFKVAPGVTIREIGWDDNVFDEPDIEGPEEDYVASVNPDIAAFARLRFVQISAYGGSELTYYHDFDTERSRGYAGRARVDVLLSKIRPFVGAGRTRTRTRPNGEVDTRADRLEEELSGGLAYDLSPSSLFYAAAYVSRFDFKEASFNRGVDLGITLTRDSNNYQGGLKTELTPFVSMQLFGSYNEDRFREPFRNSIAKGFNATFRVSPQAVFSGVATIAYRDAHFADPGVKRFRGLIGSATITYPFLEIGRFTVVANRSYEYSFDPRDAYYVDNSGTLMYTHRLVGEVDLQARVARAVADYAARLTDPPHKDTTDLAAGSLGYNLRNRTRVSVNYVYARRRSPAFNNRNFQRRRVYLSWLFAL